METIRKRVYISRIIYLGLAIIFGCSVALQFLLAGMAIFINPVNWVKHIGFAHLFGFNLPIVMLIFAFVGAMPRWSYWYLFGMTLLVFLMYFSANITAMLPWFAALHPVIGVMLLMLSCRMAVKASTLVTNK